MNGKLEKRDDIDFFRLPLKKGQTLTATIDGYGLGSAIDPFLHLYGPDGQEIALASDSRNLDPILTHAIAENGDYTIQVVAIDHKASSNVSFAGGAAMIYRHPGPGHVSHSRNRYEIWKPTAVTRKIRLKFAPGREA